MAGLLLTWLGWDLANATTFVIYPAMLCPPVATAVVVLRNRRAAGSHFGGKANRAALTRYHQR